MSVVSLLNVNVRNNPAPFAAPYEFEITFECLEPLQKDLEWKVTYVGSATSSEHDQVLDTLLVGPVPVGVNKFVFETEAPDLSKIPNTEVIGVTVVLLSCAYDDREFVRVGYYVNNEYADETLANDPPAKPVIDKVRRNILAEKPRVTRFAIKWDSEESAPAEYPPEQPDVDAAEDDEATYAAEEAEDEAALEESIKGDGEDAEMEGVEDHAEAHVPDDKDEEDRASDAGSEDLEVESSGSDDEIDEIEEDPDEDAEMGDGADEADDDERKGQEHAQSNQPIDQQQRQQQRQHQHQDVMVH